MSNLVSDARSQLSALITGAFADAVKAGELADKPIPDFTIEVPDDKAHGDFATNVAMLSAKTFQSNPRKIAQILTNYFTLKGTYFERYEIAGPGFINFFLRPDWRSQVILDILKEKENYGRTDFGNGQKVMVEFVSANPTGPMHIGNARGGALGDCLAAVLDWAGYDVTREFYINDAGNQIEKFAMSLEVRYLQLFLGEEAVELPEDAYHGADIIERAKEFADIHGDAFVSASSTDRRKALTDYALPKNVEKLRKDLQAYRIEYDVWFSESSLHQSGEIDRIIDLLKSKGLTYEKDGALFYKATEYGGEKDEVLVRANGHPTYFAADIAYHYNKFAVRGFDRVINVWGADHHGHVARLCGAMDAVGLDGSKLKIVLMQLVKLMRNGEAVRVSKRTGKSITLSDLLLEVPVDAARLFFNLREPNSHLDFDLDLAVSQNAQNPIYYVQYAHARICSILKALSADGIQIAEVTPAMLSLLNEAEEKELIFHLAALPEEIISAAKAYDPARITRFIIELATRFHKFYNACRVKGAPEDLMQARIALCIAVKTVLFNVLSMFKLSAPESM